MYEAKAVVVIVKWENTMKDTTAQMTHVNAITNNYLTLSYTAS